MPTAPRALLIGPWQRQEFQAARDHLARRMTLQSVPDVAQALARLQCDAAVALLIVAQSFPGEFSLRDAQQLQAAAPLARLCTVLGSWCEGAARSGRPWPGVARVYCHQLAARADAEDWPAAGEAPLAAWSLLPTIAPDELWLRRTEHPLPPLSGLVLVCAGPGETAETARTLTDLCHALGLRTVRLRPDRALHTRDADLVLYDAHRNRTQRLTQLRSLATQTRPARIVALVDFPRRDEIDEAIQAGCHAVLAKPYIVDDLVASLQAALVHPHRV